MKVNNTRKIYIPILILLFISLLSISVGFSAMSTSLSVNGQASFTPVDMLRITNIETYELNGTTELDKSYTYNSVSSHITLTNKNSYAIYEVTLDNLGEVDKTLEEVTNEIFSNDEMNYELIGLSYGTLIRAKDSITFKIKFKYKSSIETPTNLNLNTHLIFKFQDYIEENIKYTVEFNANGGVGTMNPMSVTYDEYVRLTTNTYTRDNYIFNGWNTESDGTGTSYNDGQTIVNITPVGETIILYAVWIPENERINYEGTCKFGGKNVALVGNCSAGDTGGYIATDIRPFNDDNYERNFELSFTIDSIDEGRMTAKKRDTFFNILHESNNSTDGIYPGTLMRIENNGKILLQGGAGYSDRTKLNFNASDVVGKKFRLIRYNNGTSNILYYMFDDDGPYVLKDVTNLYKTFDTPLSIGAGINDGTNVVDKYAYATLSDIKFEYLDDATSLDEIVHEDDNITSELETVFLLSGTCTFNGEDGNITGSTCTRYHNTNYIDTGVNLFSAENYQKDFEISLVVDSFIPADQIDNLVPIINNMTYNTDNTENQGFIFRRSANGVTLHSVDTNGHSYFKALNMTYQGKSSGTLKIVRRQNKICYKTENLNYQLLTDDFNLTEPIDIPLTIGAATDYLGNQFRFMKGTISNVQIKIGTISNELTCE